MSLVRAGRRLFVDGHGINNTIVEEASRIRVMMSSRHHHHHHHQRGLVASSQTLHGPRRRQYYHSGTSTNQPVLNDWSFQHNYNHYHQHGNLHWNGCLRFCSSSSKDKSSGEDRAANGDTDDNIKLDETNDPTSLPPPSNKDNTPNNSATKDFQIPGAQAGGKKLAIVYTCKVCNTRSVKQFSEHSYHHGVVLVKCPGCQNLHLIADRLGIFDDKDFDIQKVMAQFGEQVQVVNNDTVLELTVEDIVGKELFEKVTSSKQKDEPSKDDDDKKT